MAAGGRRTDGGDGGGTGARTGNAAGSRHVVPYNYSVTPGSGPVGAYPYAAAGAATDPYAAGAATAKTAIAYQPIFLPDGTTMMQPVLVPAQPGGWQWAPMPAPFDMAAAVQDGARPMPYFTGLPLPGPHQQAQQLAPPPTSPPRQEPYRQSRLPPHPATSNAAAFHHAQLAAHAFQETAASPAQRDIDARNAGPFSLFAEGTSSGSAPHNRASNDRTRALTAGAARLHGQTRVAGRGGRRARVYRVSQDLFLLHQRANLLHSARLPGSPALQSLPHRRQSSPVRSGQD